MDYDHIDDLNKKTYLTGVLGNELYCAPELTGDNKYRYNNSVDMYSLGIILLEMLHPMKNVTQRRKKILDDARLEEITLPESMKDTPEERIIK